MSANSYTRQAMVLSVLTGGLARLLFGGSYLSYVRPAMFVPLLVSTVAIGALALWSAFGFEELPEADEGTADEREPAGDHADRAQPTEPIGHRGHEEPDGPGHDGHGMPRIGWWLVVPVACIAIVPLKPLGASSVAEGRGNGSVVQRVTSTPAPAVELEPPSTMLDFISQVVNAPDRPIEGTVELTGFVQSSTEDGFVLARFVMSCCAADAQPLLVTVRWSGAHPPVDGWATIEGTHVPAPEGIPPEDRFEVENIVVDASSVDEVPQPRQPYESY